MFDLGHLPTGRSANVTWFNVASTVTNTQWHTWIKPLGVSSIFIMCVGGGGGGGGGATRASGTGGGAGGGGSSSTTRVLIPAWSVPDVLYVEVGAGGAGGAAAASGANGLLSYVAIYPDNSTVLNILARSGNAAATSGVAGSVAANGSGGTGGTIATIANMPLAGYGIFAFIAGRDGASGGVQSGAIGGPANFNTTSAISQGGAGGAGTNTVSYAGGLITAIANTLISDSRPSGSAAGSNDGSGAPLLAPPNGPFWPYCGLGGSSSFNGVGGNGGPAGPGSGGGGGGAGTTGGRGGNGGDGYVLLIAW